jgi:hypothetical protein
MLAEFRCLASGSNRYLTKPNRKGLNLNAAKNRMIKINKVAVCDDLRVMNEFWNGLDTFLGNKLLALLPENFGPFRAGPLSKDLI